MIIRASQVIQAHEPACMDRYPDTFEPVDVDFTPKVMRQLQPSIKRIWGSELPPDKVFSFALDDMTTRIGKPKLPKKMLPTVARLANVAGKAALQGVRSEHRRELEQNPVIDRKCCTQRHLIRRETNVLRPYCTAFLDYIAPAPSPIFSKKVIKETPNLTQQTVSEVFSTSAEQKAALQLGSSYRSAPDDIPDVTVDATKMLYVTDTLLDLLRAVC